MERLRVDRFIVWFNKPNGDYDYRIIAGDDHDQAEENFYTYAYKQGINYQRVIDIELFERG